MNNHSHNEPTIIVIFGATGDLTQKKLLPALLDLEAKDLLPDTTKVIGFSRRGYSDEEYRSFAREVIETRGHNHAAGVLERFIERIYYQQGDFTDERSYQDLEAYVDACDKEIGQCTNKLFYLAVPPTYYDIIFDNFGKTSLPENCSDETGWTRVIVEKPFGRDLETAKELDKKLGEFFNERQIFRIDHYLGKDAIQNLLTFRFTNVLFENSWSANDIKSVHIRMLESSGAEDRGELYDSLGALRDVGQNHVLQMLALTAMDSPGELEAGALREKREQLLRQLRVYTSAEDVAANTVRAQYDGYTDIDEVADDSRTETYFKVRAYVDSDRWLGVPFYLESGKRYQKGRVDITIVFRARLPCVCGKEEEHEHKNVITLALQPEHGVSMQFWVKEPGIQFDLVPKKLSFAFEESELAEKVPDAYEKLLYDCIQGDQTLFVSTSEVEAAWRFITPIVECWSQDAPELMHYKPDGDGPEDAKITL